MTSLPLLLLINTVYFTCSVALSKHLCICFLTLPCTLLFNLYIHKSIKEIIGCWEYLTFRGCQMWAWLVQPFKGHCTVLSSFQGSSFVLRLCSHFNVCQEQRCKGLLEWIEITPKWYYLCYNLCTHIVKDIEKTFSALVLFLHCMNRDSSVAANTIRSFSVLPVLCCNLS